MSRPSANNKKKPGDSGPRLASHVRLTNLVDRVAPLPREYTSISILKPVIYIERELDAKGVMLHEAASLTAAEHQDEEGLGVLDFTSSESEDETIKQSRLRGRRKTPAADFKPVEYFRISASFTLEAEIPNFDQQYQKYNRFFDSVSLRWLFRSGETYEVSPMSDNVTTGQVTEETGREVGTSAGFASGRTGYVAPTLEVHVQNSHNMTTERSMTSWRRGVTVESYPPMSDFTTQPFWVRFSKAWETPPFISFFEVNSVDTGSPQHKHFKTRPPNPRHPLSWRNIYDSSIFWSWQTDLGLHIWSPEVYQCVSLPVTITRIVEVQEIERLYRKGNHKELAKYLHFDFEVDVRVRELGHFLNFFRRSSIPPDIRVKSDSGKPLPSDLYSFCVSCTLDEIPGWPKYETPNLRQVAALYCKEMSKHGDTPHVLPSSEEFKELIRRQRQEAYVEKKMIELEILRQRTLETELLHEIQYPRQRFHHGYKRYEITPPKCHFPRSCCCDSEPDGRRSELCLQSHQPTNLGQEQPLQKASYQKQSERPKSRPRKYSKAPSSILSSSSTPVSRSHDRR